MGDGHWVGMDALLELTPTQRLLQESQPVTPQGSIHELVRPSAPCSDYVHRRLRDGASSPASPGIGNQWQCQPGGKGCKPPPLFAHDPAPRLALNWQQRRLRYQNASWLPSGWARAAQRRSSRRDIGRGGGTYPGFLYLQIITPARQTHFLGSCKPNPRCQPSVSSLWAPHPRIHRWLVLRFAAHLKGWATARTRHRR